MLGTRNLARRDSNLYRSLLDAPSLKTRTNELRFSSPACTIIILPARRYRPKTPSGSAGVWPLD